jgi:hypothetical protein
LFVWLAEKYLKTNLRLFSAQEQKPSNPSAISVEKSAKSFWGSWNPASGLKTRDVKHDVKNKRYANKMWKQEMWKRSEKKMRKQDVKQGVNNMWKQKCLKQHNNFVFVTFQIEFYPNNIV